MRTRAEQVASIQADQQFWRDLAAKVGPDRYASPGPMGAWSFGDMAGHLLGWRKRTLARLEAFSRGEAEPPNPWPAALDEAAKLDDDEERHGRGLRPGAARLLHCPRVPSGAPRSVWLGNLVGTKQAG